MEESTTSSFSVLQHIIIFLFSTVTDLALVPSLFSMAKYRRHFEMFIAISQVASALLYNFCNSFSVSIFLEEYQWHKINNVLVVCYIELLAIHLLCYPNEDTNLILRYAAFALSTVAQIRDAFWMEKSKWTIVVISLFIVLTVAKHIHTYSVEGKRPPFDEPKLTRGLGLAAGAGVFFLLGMNEKLDFLRFFHGIAHVLVGGALWFLWGVVPNLGKKFDLPGRSSEWI